MNDTTSGTLPRPKDTLLADLPNNSNKTSGAQSTPSQLLDYNREKEGLIAFIRDSVIRDPNTPIDASDILGDDIKLLSLEELRAIATNIRYYKESADRGYYGYNVLRFINIIVENFTQSTLTLESAKNDEALVEEIDSFVISYTGYLPGVIKIVTKLVSHVKEKTLAPTNITPHPPPSTPTPKTKQPKPAPTPKTNPDVNTGAL